MADDVGLGVPGLSQRAESHQAHAIWSKTSIPGQARSDPEALHLGIPTKLEWDNPDFRSSAGGSSCRQPAPQFVPSRRISLGKHMAQRLILVRPTSHQLHSSPSFHLLLRRPPSSYELIQNVVQDVVLITNLQTLCTLLVVSRAQGKGKFRKCSPCHPNLWLQCLVSKL